MTESERIRGIEKRYGLSPTALAAELGLKSTQTIYDIHKGGYGISRKLQVLILGKFKDIDPTWLRTGEGEMHNSGVVTYQGRGNNNASGDKNVQTTGNVSISGNGHNIAGHQENTNIGNTLDETIAMLETRFQHLLKKDIQIESIFAENRAFTQSIISNMSKVVDTNTKLIEQQNEERKNMREQMDRILTLLEKKL